MLVGDTGIEPVTSSVSGKRSPAELIARDRPSPESRWERDSNPCTRLCRPLPRLSAIPPREPGADPVNPLPSGRRDSNPRPSPWQGDALPTALRPHKLRRTRGFGKSCEHRLYRSPRTGSKPAATPRRHRTTRHCGVVLLSGPGRARPALRAASPPGRGRDGWIRCRVGRRSVCRPRRRTGRGRR